MTPAPIGITTGDSVAAAAVAWRFHGRLELTLVVKAQFSIVPDGLMTLAARPSIEVADRFGERGAGGSVAVASDLAPYRPRCDVLFAGHAHAYGPPQGAVTVRLGLARDGRPLLDKTLHVFGARSPSGSAEPFQRMPIVYERAVGPDEANPVGTEAPNLVSPKDPRSPAGFGPIAEAWPARRIFLGRIDRAKLDAPIAELPEEISWDYFQAAPRDQQVADLREGDWLLLEGLHPSRPRVQTRLPLLRAAARLIVQRPDAPLSLNPVALVCDTLAIDGDRQTVALTWRGRVPLPGGEAALGSIRFAAALEGDGAIDWSALITPGVSAVAKRAQTGMLTTASTASPFKPALPFGNAVDAQPSRAPLPVEATPWGGAALVPAPEPIGEGAASTLPLGVRSPFAPAKIAPPAFVPPPDDSDPTETKLAPLPLPEAVIEVLEAPPRSTSAPPPRDVWAPAPAPPPLPPMAPKARAFERPAAAQLKEALYSRFARDSKR